MAQNVTIAGASYSDVPSITVPKTGGGSANFFDVSNTTATASDVASGKYFYNSSGQYTQGTASGGGGGAAITINDTTDPVAGGIIRTITAVDISSDTVTAGSMLSGVTAHDKDGNAITGTIANGSATTPATTITANPSISISSSGLITASVSASQSITPTVSAGYISSGTAGTVSVSGSKTQQMGTTPAQTIYPSTTDYTIPGSTYLLGNQVIKGVAVSNLTAGNIKKDVVVTVGDSVDPDRIMSVTGTYEPAGTSKNFQVSNNATRTTSSSSYSASGVSLTVAVTGTYNVYWWAYRTTTSGTNGTALYINGSIYGSTHATWDNYVQTVKLTGVQLTSEDTVEIYIRSRGSSYYIATGNLTIEQTA